MPSSSGSSWPRDWICVSYVSCIGRGFFTTNFAWEAQFTHIYIFTHVLSCVTFEYPSMCCVLCWVTQSCPKLCDPWTLARQGLLSLGILQAKILEWVAMPSPRGSSQPRGWIQVSHIAGESFTILATWETHMFITVTVFVVKWLLLFLPILLFILLPFSYFIVEISKVYSRDYNQKLCLAS